MSGRIVGSVCAAAITAAAALVPPVPAATAAPALPSSRPADRSVAGLLTQLKTLYRKAEEATEAYNATEEKLRRQRTKTRELTDDLARSRTHLAASREDAGRLARQQYQGHTQLSAYTFLLTLLTPHPEDAVDQARELDRAAGREAAVVERLTKGERHADALATRARAALDKQLSLSAKKKKQRDKVKKRLTKIEKMLASLTARQITQVAEKEREETEKRQRKLLASGALGGATRRSQGAAGPPPLPDPGQDQSQSQSQDQGTRTGTGTGTGGGQDTGGGQGAGAAQPPGGPDGGTGGGTATTPVAPKTPGRLPMASASAGQRALRWALNQIGKPYVWGAEGPNAFDCSGLTSQAWAHAGRTIPRTSQEQWRRLPRISLSQIRPGDLVIYNKGASHVAIYAGGGQVVQAPRPGTTVRLSPLASNPVQGVVRPGPARG
ncbi:NlpC/P60 family protein [Streptomyces sp. NBRC 110028]|uniref:C40 family peptidase n=1 Tax=Streptomyces sp. NBRC 110028 TaxID=1621260 RepID=UPI000A5A65BA|nr:C40 family peptidase [Streptomyces sp. NBRC 110028]